MRASLGLGLLLVLGGTQAGAQLGAPQPVSAPGSLAVGKQALVSKQYPQARQIFSALLAAHPDNVTAELGLADAELGMHQYETAELEYRKVVAAQPELWVAHKNLVLVEAALGRWSEFDRERALLQAARLRGAPGITERESDLIDTFEVGNQRWIVRAYDQPVGRSLTRYNFEKFAPDGRAQEFISLESADAAQKALERNDVRIGVGGDAAPGSKAPIRDFALNWYTGKAHGTIERYPAGEPSYERVRADVIRWLKHQPHQ